MLAQNGCPRADVPEKADEQLLTETLESQLPATPARAAALLMVVPLYYQGASEHGAYPEHLAATRPVLGAYPWPENVRELENVVEREARTKKLGITRRR